MKKLFCICALYLASNLACVAQTSDDKCGCNVALKKDILLNTSNVYQTIQFAESLTKDEYNELSRDADASAKFLGIGASANYEEFQKRISQYKLDLSYNSTLISNNQFSSYTTNPIAYKYWSECKTNCKSDAVPFVSWKKYEDESGVTMMMRYNHPAQGPQVLTVQLVTIQNGIRRVQRERIRPSSNVPITIPRVFDKEGKSTVVMEVNPVLSDGSKLYDGDRFTSYYFNPLLAVNHVNLEYSDVITKEVYATGDLSVGDFGERKCSGLYSGYCNQSPAHRSSDGKYAALPCLAKFRPDDGFYFTEPSNISLVTFNASGPGAAWNMGNFSKERNTVFRQATPQYIEIMFMGTASSPTSWQVARVEAKNIRPVQQVGFFYGSKQVLNFSVPLNRLKDYTITLNTHNNGVFTIDKNNESSFTYGDANGYRNFQINLEKLRNPELGLATFNIKNMQIPETKKTLKKKELKRRISGRTPAVAGN